MEPIKNKTMKIYSLENIKTPLDLVCMTENIKTDISCVIVLHR